MPQHAVKPEKKNCPPEFLRGNWIVLLFWMTLSCGEPSNADSSENAPSVDSVIAPQTYCWECTSITSLVVKVFGDGLVSDSLSSADTAVTEICDMTESEIRLYERVGTMKISKEDFTYEAKVACTQKQLPIP